MSINSILAEYAAYQNAQLQQRNARAAEAYEHIPALAEADALRRAAVQDMAQNIRAGMPQAEARQAFDAAIANAEQLRAKLLLEAGYPADHLEVHYRCAVCRDTGYVGETLQKPCACLIRALQRERAATSAVNERETFERFDESVYTDAAQKKLALFVKNTCEAYANGLTDAAQKPNLLLFGDAGLGKSFLINAVAARALALGLTVEKTTAYNLIGEVLAGIKCNADALPRFVRAGLLLIDDLGTEAMMKNITLESLFTIVNERGNARRPTMIATNLDFEQLQARYGERLFSRLVNTQEGIVLELTGSNLRLR